MNAVLTREDRVLNPAENEISEIVSVYAAKLENADTVLKNSIENELVNMGIDAVPAVVSSLQSAAGAARGVLAMVLIRIGGASISCLKRAAEDNKNFKWAADYLINEIKCAA